MLQLLLEPCSDPLMLLLLSPWLPRLLMRNKAAGTYLLQEEVPPTAAVDVPAAPPLTVSCQS
jgi:hypothetical protein